MSKPNSAHLIAQNLAGKVVEQIKSKKCVFESPMIDGFSEPVQPTKSVDGREYTNQTNMFITLMNSMMKSTFGYKYATRERIKKLGGYVSREEIGNPTVIEKNFMMYIEKKGKKAEFWPYNDKERIKELKKKGIKPFWVRRTNDVFNVVGQTENLPDKYYPDTAPSKIGDKKFIMDTQHKIKKLVSNNDIKITHKICTPMVSYRPEENVDGKINIPKLTYFKNPQTYFATFLHECVHHAGLPDRLGFLTGSDKGSQHYAHEELRAEFGAVFMCANLELPYEQHMDSHANYCKGWLELLENDSGLILELAGDVVLTSDFMKNNSPEMDLFYKACNNNFEKHLVSLCVATGKDMETQLELIADGKGAGITRLSKYHMSSVAMNFPDQCGVGKDFEYTTAVTDEQVKDIRKVYRDSAAVACADLIMRVENAFDEVYEQTLSEDNVAHESEILPDVKPSDDEPSQGPTAGM